MLQNLNYSRLIICIILLLFVNINHSLASDLSYNEAIKRGLIGEREDGLVGIVLDINSDIYQLVNSTNSERSLFYISEAKKLNLTPEEVAKKSAINNFRLLPVGSYYMINNKWIKK